MYQAMPPSKAPTRAINRNPTNAPNHFPAVDPKSLSNPDTGASGIRLITQMYRAIAQTK
ncbi:hypothetical protein EsCd1HHP024_02410 [Escherichia sp. HH091_1A]|nr:hypothetical protein EsCd1HHP024_02410 [Escherichia sp. HH091_1A]BDI51413.1 hypothetical protein EsCd1KSP079_02398 [Escherichia sp. KS167_9B]